MASRMIQNNFSGGELSPSLFGRSDLQAYYKGCADAENFVISKEGTLRKRHGISDFAAPLTIPLVSDFKMLPYKFDREAGGFFVCTSGDDGLTIRFYDKDGSLHAWTEGTGAEQVTVDHRTIADFAGTAAAIQYKQIGDELWITNGEFHRTIKVTDNERFDITVWQQSQRPQKVVAGSKNLATTNWWVEDHCTTGGGTIGERTLVYGCIAVRDSVNSETTTKSVKWTATWQAGSYVDLFVRVNKADIENWDYIAVAKRTGSAYGELTRFYMAEGDDFGYDSSDNNIHKWSDGKWYNHAQDEVFLWTDKWGDEYDGRWYDTDEDKVWKWQDGRFYDRPEDDPDAESAVEVTVTEVTVEERTLSYYKWNFRDENHTPSDMIYGQTNVLGDGFTTPRCIDCFQQRRVFANAQNAQGKMPMTLWFSEVGNLNNFYADRPATDADPFSPTIATSGPAFIRFTAAYQEMLVLFTDSGLFSVGFANTTGFSSNSCRISKFSDLSCSPDIQPVVTDAGIVFVGADRKTVYSISYSLQENMLKPINRSVLVEHLTRLTPIRSIALQAYPDNVVWVVTEDGKACTLTLEKNEEVYSWSHSLIEGARFVDVISLGTCTDSTTDRTYGDLVFAVEKNGILRVCRPNDGYADSVGGETTNVRAEMTTLRPESQERTIVGYKKNIRDILLRLYQSGGLSARSPDGGDMPLVDAKMPGVMYSGDVKVMPRGVINQDGQLTVVSDNADPCEILQLVIDVEIE